MCCEQCRGLMVLDACLTVECPEPGVWAYVLRCLNCGRLLIRKSYRPEYMTGETGRHPVSFIVPRHVIED